MKADVLGIDGSKKSEIDLPPVFETQFRPDLIRRVHTCLESHRFQPKGTHPTAGMDVVARSNDPPTGRGVSRIAKMRGGGGGRMGQAGGVASVRGGRQAHPPKVEKVTRKEINRKERRLALRSAIAATASEEAVRRRGHEPGDAKLPLVVSDDVEKIQKASVLAGAISSLGLGDDAARLSGRKARTGKAALRGRAHKRGRSVLFVVSAKSDLQRACGSIPGVEAREASRLSVLDLAPGGEPARLVVYSESAVRGLGAAA